MKKTRWILFVLGAIAIGCYPAIYFVVDWPFGLLTTKSDALLSSIAWKAGFYIHIIGGGIALLIGCSVYRFATVIAPYTATLGKCMLYPLYGVDWPGLRLDYMQPAGRSQQQVLFASHWSGYTQR